MGFRRVDSSWEQVNGGMTAGRSGVETAVEGLCVCGRVRGHDAADACFARTDGHGNGHAHTHDGDCGDGGRGRCDGATLLRRLAEAGYKLTGPRRVLAETIAARDRSFTAADILNDVRAQHPDIGRATVFRTLDRLVALGAIARVHLDSGSPAYAVCDDHEEGHHHDHLICSTCGAVVDLPQCPLDASLERLGREAGFRIFGHRLEVFGQCPRCTD